MKILMIITRGDVAGGAQTHVQDLARHLTAAGQTIAVITGSSGLFTESLSELGIEVRICPELVREIDPVKDVRAVFRLRDMIRQIEPDLVATHSSKAGMVGRVAARLAGVPCVFTAHGWAFTDGVSRKKQVMFRAIERIAARFTERIICVSDFDRRIGIAAGIPARKQIVILNGVEDISPDPAARPAESVDPERVHVVMVARFERPKDQDLLVTAARSVGNVHLDFVGGGPRLDDVRRLVSDLGMSHRVTFHGRRSDIPDLLAQSQIFALISHFEGFPISTLEAMRGGLPTIVSDVGGSGEAVTDGETGFLVPRGDVKTLTAKLALLAGQPDLRRRMGKAARARFETEFTVERMVSETLAVYREVAGCASPARLIHKARPDRRTT